MAEPTKTPTNSPPPKQGSTTHSSSASGSSGTSSSSGIQRDTAEIGSWVTIPGLDEPKELHSLTFAKMNDKR
ncbi:hypothetical protein N7448_003938 [Penicillium atrosanguineum]|uniref:Uncharacterized protein n=1 Tax=Penicillium atrosanguineum TaxID=1132637 RepID=A0A9W9H885_9EURO|nr:Casein kinase II subunit alpha [Penicillium atrosanguineum]KAJ5140530.1 hypothetical protein N7448_003938 [Penicillium atrosanguineum]KAJ5310443.1 Casein kinase II subunit alpha [Penicillium atrosanguineum]KAJ5315963.1 hypothetical protein N7476_006270 [Penicillium atrosanguineum]